MAGLTKSESALLERLRSHGRAGVTKSHGRGPEGGKVRGGHRAYMAALSLIRKGLAVEVARNQSRDTRNGWTVHISDLTIRAPSPDPET